jgi:two-component system, NarL family, sensor histidine kinase DevS
MDDASRQLITVARGVLEQLDLEIVLRRVLDAAQQLTGASYAALGVLDESRSELARFLTRGIDEPTRRRIGPLPTGRGVLGELIRNPVPLRIDDVGSHPYSYGFPVGHPAMRTFLGVPIVIDDAPWGNLYLTEKGDGRPFDEDDEQAAMLLAQFAGLAIDHARRYTQSEQQRGGLQRTVDALEATMQITRALGGETDLDAILELVAKRGRALVSARALVIELLEGDQLHFANGAGELPAELLGRRVPLHGTVGSVALRERATQRLSDPGNYERFEQHGLGQLGIDTRDALVVPLMFRERGYGVLVALDSRDTDAFTLEHQRLLEAFAASAAIAVATARSAADERQRQRLAAADAERARWARELHDETLQALGNLRLVLAGGARSTEVTTMGEAIGRAVDQLDLDIANLRALITELRPAALDQLGLDPALTALADRVRASGLAIDTSIDLAYEAGTATQRLTPEVENAAYRIVQESLTNAVKHGSAHRAVVEVDDSAAQLRLTVRDDGVGFDPTVATSGFGLVGMRERVELLGGDLQIESSPGAGTTVTVTLPIARRDGGDRAASADNGQQPVQ